MTLKEMILMPFILFSTVVIIAILLGIIVHKDMRQDATYKYCLVISIIMLLISLYLI